VAVGFVIVIIIVTLLCISLREEHLVHVVEVFGCAAVEVMEVITDEVALIEDGGVGTQEAGQSAIRVAVVEHLAP